MATNAAANQARQQHRQVANTLRSQINWNDSGITATAGSIRGQLPQGAFITQFFIEVVTAFNGTSPVLSVGTNATADNMVAGADVDATATGVYDLTEPLGRSFTASDVANIAAKLSVSGSPSAGQAELVIVYEANMG